MVDRYNRYNQPGFVQGMTSTYDALNDMRSQMAVQDEENAPASALGLQSVATPNPNDTGPQPVDPNSVNETTPQGLESARVGPTMTPPTAADVATARAAKRASIMRQYGDYDGANKEQSSDAALGLEQANITGKQTSNQEAALKLASDKQVADNQAKAKAIVDQYTAPLQALTSPDGSPRAPTDDETFQAQRHTANALAGAGLNDQASALTEQLRKSVTDKVEADAVPRAEEGKQASAGLATGDFTAFMDFVKKYGYGSGVTYTSITPDGKGGVALSMMKDGQPVNQTVPLSDFQKKATDFVGSLTSKDASKFVLEADHLRAQIAQEKASTNASNASASRSASLQDEDETKADHDQLLQEAYDTEDDKRTPAQKQLIQGFSDKADDGRAFRGGNSGKAQLKVMPDGSSMRIDPDGTTWSRARGAATWTQITDAPAGGGGGAPAPKPGAASPPAAAPSTIPADPKQRKVGQVYTNAQGVSATWTGTGWRR